MASSIISKREVVWNNMVNGYLDSTGWKDRSSVNTHTTFENGIATTTFLNEEPTYISYRTMMCSNDPKVLTDHIYIVKCEVNSNRTVTTGFEWGCGYQESKYAQKEIWTEIIFRRYGRKNGTGYLYVPFIHGNNIEPGLIVKTRNVLYIDLTQMYEAGNEPSIEEFKAQCTLNGVDLSSPQPMDAGTTRDWYIPSESNFPNLSEARRRIIVSNPHLITPAPAGLVSFDTNIIAPLKECKVYFEPVQEGSGDPSPDNIRPITGWTGVNMYQSGKNLWPHGDTDARKPLFLKKDTVVVASVDYVSQRINIAYHNQSGSQIDYWTLVDKGNGRKGCNSFSLLRDAFYFMFWDWNGLSETITKNPMIAIYSDAYNVYEYEPYIGQNHTINWSDSAGTIYGGYIDLTRGVLVETQRIFASTWGELILRGSYADGTMAIKRLITDIPVYPTGNSHDKSFSNIVPKMWKWTESVEPHYYVGDSENIWVFLPSDTNNDTLIQVVCNLVEPVVYQLDPIVLKTLKGINNIWSNANGDIEIKYWTH